MPRDYLRPEWYLEETKLRRQHGPGPDEGVSRDRVTADLDERGSNLEQSLMRVSDNARAAATLLASKLACSEVAAQAERIAPLLASKVRPIDPEVRAALSRLYGRSERP